jgi:hypothetical protein
MDVTAGDDFQALCDHKSSCQLLCDFDGYGQCGRLPLKITVMRGRLGFETRGILFEACTGAMLFKSGVSDGSSPPTELTFTSKESKRETHILNQMTITRTEREKSR